LLALASVLGVGEGHLLHRETRWVGSRYFAKSESLFQSFPNYYFKKLPFSGAFGYESFASFMSTSALLSCVRAGLPMSHADVELLLYYLVPALKKFAKGQADYQLIADFATEAQNATLG
jgi:hypothetical protein